MKFSEIIHSSSTGKRRGILLFGALLAMAAAVFFSWPSGVGNVAAIRKKGELVVLTRNAPTTYYLDRDSRPAGLEADLARAFGEELGVAVRFEVRDSVEGVLAALAAGEGDLAAAGLTRTEARRERFLTGEPYQEVRQQVVCRRGGRHPKNPEDLIQVEMAVIADSSYAERLRQLAQDIDDLQWQPMAATDTETVLDLVARGELDCTVADSNIVALNRRYHPELIVAFDLTKPEPLVWYLPAGAIALQTAVNGFLARVRENGRLARIRERYFGHVQIYNYVDTQRFLARIRSRLPRYLELFRKAANENGFDWTLLAAQSYQESYWNRKAKSPTGVRGLMMITLATARELGVKSRLDPEQSVMGGALYLRRLKERLPAEIREPDRTWLALAAYNVGFGHLRDARELAATLGRNPNTWNGLKEVLPLLARKEYYRKLRFGYARGDEPVMYVSRIRNFQDLLVRALAVEEEAVAEEDPAAAARDLPLPQS